MSLLINYHHRAEKMSSKITELERRSAQLRVMNEELSMNPGKTELVAKPCINMTRMRMHLVLLSSSGAKLHIPTFKTVNMHGAAYLGNKN